MSPFSHYVGIDWSGAKGKSHPGLQVAIAEPGTSAPSIVKPPRGVNWSRNELVDYLLVLAKNSNRGKPTLAGLDFAFAHPFSDFGQYFPGNKKSPKNVSSLWALVEEVNFNEVDLYGGAIFRHPVWSDYYIAPPNYTGSKYQSRRRLTEVVAGNLGQFPSLTFKAVGPDNVSTGSLAGMRLLYQIKKRLGPKVMIWPFEMFNVDKTQLVLVEVFPSFYFAKIDMPSKNKAAAESYFLSRALSKYNSEGVDPNFISSCRDADDADAIISAAAIRYLSKFVGFNLPAEILQAAKFEGWIYGV